MRLGKVRLEAQGLLITGCRFLQLALLLKGVAKAGVGRGVVRFQLDGLAKCSARFLQLALLCEGVAGLICD